jgi:hypothetical protein
MMKPTPMRFTIDRPYSDPDKAARRLMKHARAFEPMQDGRASTSKCSTVRSCSEIRARLLSMPLASIGRLRLAGSNCMIAARS